MPWFETKIRTEKQVEGGLTKPETQTFLVDAFTFTEAETRITEEMGHFSSNFKVMAIKNTKINEIFFDTEREAADKYYLVKCAFVTIDEKSAKEKKTYSLILVQATDFTDALDCFKKGMSGTMADYDIVSIVETPILDVYKADLGGAKE